jgi:hypothetical protein
MRSIVRRADGAGWQAMLGELARTSGIATPCTDRLRQFDRTRQGKRVSNADWTSPSDPEARITRLKDGRTRLAYKPEHAVDLDTGAILAAEIQPGDAGDTLDVATANLDPLDLAPAPADRSEVVADKGYHARDLLKRLADSPWTTGSPSPRAAACSAGTAMTTRGARATPTAPACSRGRPGGADAPGGPVRADIRARARPRWHAPDLVARAGQCRQALPDPRRRPQSRPPDAEKWTPI